MIYEKPQSELLPQQAHEIYVLSDPLTMLRIPFLTEPGAFFLYRRQIRKCPALHQDQPHPHRLHLFEAPGLQPGLQMLGWLDALDRHVPWFVLAADGVVDAHHVLIVGEQPDHGILGEAVVRVEPDDVVGSAVDRFEQLLAGRVDVGPLDHVLPENDVRRHMGHSEGHKPRVVVHEARRHHVMGRDQEIKIHDLLLLVLRS